MKTAYATIKGFEVMRMIRKRQCILLERGVTGEVRLVNKLFALRPPNPGCTERAGFFDTWCEPLMTTVPINAPPRSLTCIDRGNRGHRSGDTEGAILTVADRQSDMITRDTSSTACQGMTIT